MATYQVCEACRWHGLSAGGSTDVFVQRDSVAGRAPSNSEVHVEPGHRQQTIFCCSISSASQATLNAKFPATGKKKHIKKITFI